MNTKNHPWENIYARDGHIFTEPFSAFSSVAQKFNQNQCRNILDLGCGNGRHVIALMNLNFGTVGLDISPTGLSLTQEIHHSLLTEIRSTISEIWRVMTDGGIAFVTVAGKKHEDTPYDEIEPGTFVPLEGSEKGLPHHIFTEEELFREFKLFQIQEISLRDKGRARAIWLKKSV